MNGVWKDTSFSTLYFSHLDSSPWTWFWVNSRSRPKGFYGQRGGYWCLGLEEQMPTGSLGCAGTPPSPSWRQCSHSFEAPAADHVTTFTGEFSYGGCQKSDLTLFQTMKQIYFPQTLKCKNFQNKEIKSDPDRLKQGRDGTSYHTSILN